MFAFTTLLSAFVGVAAAQNVLFEASDFKATVYYDLDTATDICAEKNGGPFASNWAVDTGINNGGPYCQPTTTDYTLSSLGSNRIVAMNYTMVSGDKEKWCGKEVQIFDETGKQITIDEGPFVLYDACAACMSTGIIDVSAKAFAAIKGGNCGGNNPTGLTVKIIDNNVSPSGTASNGSPPASAVAAAAVDESSVAPAESAAPASAAETSSTFSIRGTGSWWASASATPTAKALPSVAAAFVLPASESASFVPPLPTTTISVPAKAKVAAAKVDTSSPGGCTYGAWQCNGLSIEVCNHAAEGLVWQSVGSCPTRCSVDGTQVVCA